MERVEIIVYGRVQGVAFRWYAQTRAQQLGVTGWVRNRPDGSVRMIAEGERGALEVLVDWAASGPTHARVERRDVHWCDATGTLVDFEIVG